MRGWRWMAGDKAEGGEFTISTRRAQPQTRGDRQRIAAGGKMPLLDHGFIATLAGLAMLRVLQASFATAFEGRFGFGALITFLITVSGISVANIGAPFWGLVFGYIASQLLEPSDFRIQPAPDIQGK